MNFDLQDELKDLISLDKLDDAIILAERKLQAQPSTAFHSILGKNLLHLATPLADFMEDFYKSLKPTLKIKALYGEMNGFTINPDLWFLLMFAYDTYEGLDDLDWLADYEHYSEDAFVLTGFEDLQNAYKDYHKKKKYKDEHQRDANETCELIIILRLQELLRAAVKTGKAKGMKWVKVPVLVTAHDYDLIYKAS
ncbi:hypothetical protein [Chryseolinea soli]|uniref:Uncharacterized protein n=1 Tax=Chryseolinea soli TaxID=2321403 RepID=A0A385SG03_9BACT|nr:hypothetical protein [Chryseolinea soli]AYB29336.1 hypothetical protein D4L85_01495 [Chryseolinea soli]